MRVFTSATLLAVLSTALLVAPSLVPTGSIIGDPGAGPTASPPFAVARYDLHRTGAATDVGAPGTPTVAWTFATAGTSATSPLAADLTGDGRAELFFGEVRPGPAADNSRLGYIVDASGSLLYTVSMRYNSVASAAADLTGDGALEVVFSEGAHSQQAGGIGYRVFQGAGGAPLWTITTPSLGGEEGFFASPALTDVDGDGVLDLIAPSMDRTVYALRGADGTVLWRTAGLGHYVRASAPLADLDGDGRLEVVAHTEAGVVYVFDALTGAERWRLKTGQIVASTPTVGDLDGDGSIEVVVAHVVTGGIAALRADGTVLWQNLAHDYSYRGPALVDLDGDGRPDVIDGDSDDASVTAYRGTDGAILWEVPLGLPWSSGPIVTADVDGDGDRDVLFGTDAGLVAVDAAGGLLWQVPLPPVRGEPLVRDLDGDGVAEIAVGAGDGRVYVLAFPQAPTFEPRTIGYWKHQCTVDEPKGDHLGISQAYVDEIASRSAVFRDLQSRDEACTILQGPRGNDMRARAEQQLLALWLNVVSGLVDEGAPIDLPMTTATTVAGAIADAEAVLTGTPDRADLERAKDLCDALNNGMR